MNQIVPRQAALKAGLGKYFSGKPCKHGHVAERYLPKNACCECQNIASNRRAVTNPQQKLFWSAKSRALASGTAFTLEFNDITWPDVCPVFGTKLVYGNKLRNRDNSPSIDRIDNEKGYTKENTVVVSFRANRFKSDSTPAELLALASFYNSKH